MTHGLKALAQELPKYGRMGDTMVAHINPQEAQMLKAMGGSGTTNPTTGLPEFGNPFKKITSFIGNLNPLNPNSGLSKTINTTPIIGDVNKALNNVGTKIFQPVEKAIVQPASRGLAQFDKAVGKTIPGGWGTVASIAGSAMGLPTPAMVGIGALNGSGVTRRGGSFNLQGAMMGGAMAYGMSELGDYVRAAGTTAPPIDTSVIDGAVPATLPTSNVAVAGDPISSLNASQNFTGPNATDLGSNIPQSAINSANAAGAVQNINPATNLPYGSAIGDTLSGNAQVAPSGYGQNVKDFGAGIKNLSGFGDITAKEAVANAATFGVKPMMAAGATIYGGMGLAALDEQRKYLDESKKANAISQAEYDSKLSEINRQADIARKTVAAHPFNINPSRDVSIGDTYYGRTGSSDTAYDKARDSNVTLYAAGGDVDGQLSLADYMTANSNQASSPLKMASGGMPPRFLSGGGDGMSDSIDASIGGNQPAKLADGEFVVPADVVSHLGNGSSKAGAKRLYSMMDKVRVARTGNKKQGKQINPMKFMPA